MPSQTRVAAQTTWGLPAPQDKAGERLGCCKSFQSPAVTKHRKKRINTGKNGAASSALHLVQSADFPLPASRAELAADASGNATRRKSPVIFFPLKCTKVGSLSWQGHVCHAGPRIHTREPNTKSSPSKEITPNVAGINDFCQPAATLGASRAARGARVVAKPPETPELQPLSARQWEGRRMLRAAPGGGPGGPRGYKRRR